MGTNNGGERPRGGYLDQEKQRRKFSITGERAPGMLLLANQFHDSFECLSVLGHKKYFGSQSEASIYRAALSSFTNQFTCKLDCFLYNRDKFSPLSVSVWLMQESFPR